MRVYVRCAVLPRRGTSLPGPSLRRRPQRCRNIAASISRHRAKAALRVIALALPVEILKQGTIGNLAISGLRKLNSRFVSQAPSLAFAVDAFRKRDDDLTINWFSYDDRRPNGAVGDDDVTGSDVITRSLLYGGQRQLCI